MANSSSTGISRIIRATGYSWKGMRAAYRHEAAFRQEVWLCIVMIPLGLYLGENGIEKALLVSSVALLPITEMLNSAMEAVVDRFGGEHHELSGRAKDMASAAVLMAFVLMIVVWVLVLFF